MESKRFHGKIIATALRGRLSSAYRFLATINEIFIDNICIKRIVRET